MAAKSFQDKASEWRWRAVKRDAPGAPVDEV